jgi:predicted Zn-dependent protease
MSQATASKFLERNPLRTLLGMPQAYLDQAMALAYRLYQSGSYADAEVMCRGLLAADHRYWWAYSLHAAVLLKLGKPREALTQIDLGLRYEPGQPKLLAMKTDILAAAALLGTTARQNPSVNAKKVA